MKKKKVSKIISIIVIIVILVLATAYSHCLFKVLPSSLMLSSHTQSAPTLIAHRGLSSLYPQNTLPAFQGAAEYQYKYYELDLHTTADGKWVVIHNDTVDDMTDGTGDVDSFTLEQLQKLTIDSGNAIESFEGLTIPDFEQCLDICEKTGILPVIELKKCDVKYFPDLVKIIDKYALSKKAKIISFDKEYLTAYRELDSEIEMLYLSKSPTKEDIDWCMEHDFGINYKGNNLYKCFPAIRYANKNDVTVAAWTVDNTVIADILVLFGAEYITTNKILP